MAIRRLALLLKIISAHQLTEFCNGVVRQIGLEAAVSHSTRSDPTRAPPGANANDSVGRNVVTMDFGG
jgi:hypothetical protein